MTTIKATTKQSRAAKRNPPVPVKDLLRKIVTFFTLRLRCMPVLLVLQKYYHLHPVRRLSRVFDPNYLRKVARYRYKPKLAMISFGQTRLWVDVNDHIGFTSFVRNEPFETMVHTISRNIGIAKGDVILDIGANIGTASIPICRETGCELAAIEASKETAALLLRNIALNQVKAHVGVVALSSNDAAGQFLKLHLRDGNRGANSLVEDWSPSRAVSAYELVPTMTLDQYIEQSLFAARIKLIKIDVEGAELDVVLGGKSFLERNTAPILMEYRPDANAQARGKLEQLISVMTKAYDVSALDEAGNKTGFDPRGSYENILFERKTCKSADKRVISQG